MGSFLALSVFTDKFKTIVTCMSGNEGITVIRTFLVLQKKSMSIHLEVLENTEVEIDLASNS